MSDLKNYEKKLREEAQIVNLELEIKSEESKELLFDDSDKKLREEAQIVNLELEMNKEQFNKIKNLSPKLFD